MRMVIMLAGLNIQQGRRYISCHAGVGAVLVTSGFFNHPRHKRMREFFPGRRFAGKQARAIEQTDICDAGFDGSASVTDVGLDEGRLRAQS